MIKPLVLDLSRERWLAIPEYDGLYEVSDQGRVRSRDRMTHHGGRKPWRLKGRIFCGPARKQSGHVAVVLRRGGISTTESVHRLVLLAFKGKCPPNQESRHWDDDPSNNRLDNLLYGTRAENIADRSRNGYVNIGNRQNGERSAQAKLSDAQAIEISRSALSAAAASARYNIGICTIYNIRSGKQWSAVTGVGA